MLLPAFCFVNTYHNFKSTFAFRFYYKPLKAERLRYQIVLRQCNVKLLSKFQKNTLQKAI